MQDILLAQKAKNGNREAMDRLVRKYYQPIYNYIYRRTSNKEVAEDLTQETFLKLVRAIGRYVPTAKFSTFLYRIAHNTVIDYYRTVKEEAEEIPESDCTDVGNGIVPRGDLLERRIYISRQIRYNQSITIQGGFYKWILRRRLKKSLTR